MRHASAADARLHLRGRTLALADLFDDENIYLRAQAIDTFMQLTSTELHDRFAEPTLEPPSTSASRARPSVQFVSKITNVGEKKSFPGGSYYCLQISPCSRPALLLL